jgi:tetratricopeptide (TPR) repeat protein
MRECREQGDGLLALQTYGNFAQFLQDHPARNDLILESARILMELDQRQGAEKALKDLGPAASLSGTQQDKLNRLKQELALDPADPAAVKRDAPALQGPEYEDTGRARATRLLAQVHANEGNHEEAAQEYLSATELKNLSWKERVRFCQNAAHEYGLADKPAKILEAAEQGLKDIQSAGVPLVETGASGGNLLLLKAENLTRLGDYPKSAIAYQQYLDLFPTAAQAPLARYSLARAYELGNESEKALKEYERLAQSKEDPFWSQTARGTAEQLRWEVEHPYVIRKEATP